MTSLVIYKQKVSEWETCPHYITSYPTSILGSLEVSLPKRNMEFVCAEPINRSYSREELTAMLRKFMATMSKVITRDIIEGRKVLPNLKDLGKTSRNICTVVTSRGANLYISLPIHCYHAWRLLEDNNKIEMVKLTISAMAPGRLFIRLPTLQELDAYTFVHHEGLEPLPLHVEYTEKLRISLGGTIYEHACRCN